MAYLAATVLDAFRLKYSESNFDVYEHRKGNYGILSAFQADTPNLVSAATLEANRKAGSHDVTIPVIQNNTYSSASSRSCTGKTDSNTSALVTPSWTTYSLGFHMVPSQYANNQIAYAEDFEKKMWDMQKQIANMLDAALYTVLNTYKNTADTSGIPGGWSYASNVLQIPNADKDQAFNYISAILDLNNLPFDDINVIGTTMLRPFFQHLVNQGVGNAVNYAYQFGPYNIRTSNNVSLSAGAANTFFYMPKGTIGLLTWCNIDSQMNAKSGDGKEWSRIFLPMLGFEVELLHQSTCADNSTEAGSGMEASLIENFNFSFDYAPIYAYASGTGRPIFKADVLTT